MAQHTKEHKDKAMIDKKISSPFTKEINVELGELKHERLETPLAQIAGIEAKSQNSPKVLEAVPG